MAPENRDFPISPDSYCYLQNIGSGGVLSVKKGPTVVSLTGQDQPVRYDSNRRTFQECSLEHAVQQFPRAGEGDYVVIENPSRTENGKEFPEGASSNAIELNKGSKIVIPGPWSEALWPGQIAHVVEGHRLRSNQYLIAIIYNADEAETNWDTETVVKPQTEGTELEATEASTPEEQSGLPRPESFAVGTRIVIKGTDVSFYIPCTGVEVLKDEETKNYVREAVTLEQMEYCCLIDESGKKDYPKGPKVVFPRPTQVFDMDNKKRRKFRPLELNTINGVHLKVTVDFTGDDLEKIGPDGSRPKRDYKEGEELFVTGKTLAIYYPREELAIIEYGQGNKKHFSTAIPKGEGRYLINRETGEIKLIKGPKMLLPDPRTEILVRRILSPDECESMYPGNQEALAYNLDLAQVMQESPSGRSGLVSEGDYRKRIAKAASRRGPATFAAMDEATLESLSSYSDDYEPESVGTEGGAAKSLTRGTRYTEPRQLTLNTKYDGVPKIEVFPGYAVLVVGSEGSRRVVEGPKSADTDENFMFLLEYDEKLGSMHLSTGKPKNTDRLLRTSYLCVANNQVGDIIGFESKDHVRGTVKISMRVNFEADSEADKLKWFSVPNYVKYLCDHVRSIIAGMGKRHTIAEIRQKSVDLIRDAILGEKPTGSPDASEPLHTTRPGLLFEDNGMKVIEVEVLPDHEGKLVTIGEPTIANLLDQAQTEVVKSNIQLEQSRRSLEVSKEHELIAQEKEMAVHETEKLKIDLRKQILTDQLDLALAQFDAELNKLEKQIEQQTAEEGLINVGHEAKLLRQKNEADQKLALDASEQKLALEMLTEETSAAVRRFEAAKEGLYEVLMLMHREDVAATVAQGCTIERYLSGDSMGASIANLLSMVPSLQQFLEAGQGNGSNRLRETANN